MGITFKENCTDIRNSGCLSLVKELKKFNLNLDLYDPWANGEEVKKIYNTNLCSKLVKNTYDGIIIPVGHKIFKKIGVKTISKLCKKNHVIFDLKHIFSKDQADLRL